jgi:hypothetical protein
MLNGMILAAAMMVSPTCDAKGCCAQRVVVKTKTVVSTTVCNVRHRVHRLRAAVANVGKCRCR